MSDFLGRTNRVFFGLHDPNLDGQKRNLSVAVFSRFRDEAIWAYVENDIAQRFRTRSAAAWLEDWKDIVARRDPEELTRTLIGHDEVDVRRRGAITCAGLLSAEDVLRIKRKFR